jgi:hypothetical protein
METPMIIILPLVNSDEARKLFNKEIANKHSITMLIFGDGDDIAKIANDAKTCATHTGEIGHVVWVKDLSFLSPDEVKKYRKEDSKIIVCTLNLKKAPVVFLNLEEAQDVLNLEKAFLTAEED